MLSWQVNLHVLSQTKVVIQKTQKNVQGIEFEPYILHILDDIVLAKHLNSQPF